MRPTRVKQPEVLRVVDAAVLLGMDTETIRRALRLGGLPGFKVGREWRIPADVVERLLVGSGGAPEGVARQGGSQ